jgi:hypothetical protein
MKRFFVLLLFAATTTIFSSCYREPNPLDSVAQVGDYVALVRTFQVRSATNTLVTSRTATPGTTLTFVITYTTLDLPVTAVNLYTQVGATRTRVANASVSVSPSPNRVTQELTYTIPAGTPAGRIGFLGGVVTAGGESFSGAGTFSATGAPTLGSVTITVQ